MVPLYLVTGGFDPLHSGHIELLSIGSKAVVGLNSDAWLHEKRKDRPEQTWFLPWKERKVILEALGTVSRVLAFDDSQGHAVDFLEKVREMYGPEQRMVFVNGGDRKSSKDIPVAEREALERLRIAPRFMQTGKANSSRSILEDYLRRTSHARY